jgi:hypothetical protein
MAPPYSKRNRTVRVGGYYIAHFADLTPELS